MKNRAFTLLELLVVITIIGILSSIVIVSMSDSTDSATIAKGKAYAQQVHALLGYEAVLDLNFNENATGVCSDGKDVCDASGYNNNGTVYGAFFVSSSVDGYALSFDGTNDYIQLPNLGSLSSFTIEGWIRGDGDSLSGATGYNTFVGSSGSNRLLYSMGGLMLAQMGAGNHHSSAVVSRGQWNHIAYVYNNTNSTAKWYINGNPDSELVGAISFSQPTKIGAYDVVNYMMNGLIDDVRIYSEALPATEIQKYYVQGLDKLLVNQVITQLEYDQRMAKFNQSLVLYE
jgi:prepilin-type N-terminal cleavage/methylation domain-containing protein